MKNVAEAAKQALTSTTRVGQTSLPASHSEADSEIVNLAFKQLTQIFPAWRQAVHGSTEQEFNAWSSGYKGQLVRAFSEQRINSVEKLKHGLKLARDSGGDFMPGPGKFAKWCKIYQAPYHVPFSKENAIPHLPSTQEHAAEQIAKIKAKLGQSHRGTSE